MRVVTLHQWACKRMYYRVYQRVGYASPGVWRGNTGEGGRIDHHRRHRDPIKMTEGRKGGVPSYPVDRQGGAASRPTRCRHHRHEHGGEGVGEKGRAGEDSDPWGKGRGGYQTKGSRIGTGTGTGTCVGVSISGSGGGSSSKE